MLQKNIANLRIKKVACWNCCKLITKDFVINTNEFCNLECYQKYNRLYLISCQFYIRLNVQVAINNLNLKMEQYLMSVAFA
ncbi:unnamed protein product [Paramecium sonneborni]|uniref:Uncharacterized protein n=1 Tax=Paramecium sonneborni TaxID=65129 RepID=A0A8S1N895_9CILI|nr:unnamed protein product [Paramecium sonneborni]